MTQTFLYGRFKSFAQSLEADIHSSPHGRSVHYIDLQSSQHKEGYVRVSVDAEDDALTVEVATPFSCIFAGVDKDLRDLLTVCLTANPCKNGKRLFPTIDMGNEHLLLSYVVGGGTVHGTADFSGIAEACVQQVQAMLAEVKTALAAQHASGPRPHALQSRMSKLVSRIPGAQVS